MEMHRLHDELAAALEACKWKTAKNRAKGIIRLLPIALDPATSKAGTPHLDGVYNIGFQKIFGAPEETVAVVRKMNDLIHVAKLKLGKKKKKKKNK